jgi:hypothetical protein
VVSSVALADIGKASGTFSTRRQLGGAFRVAILVAVFAGSGGYGTAQAFSDGFVPAIAVSPRPRSPARWRERCSEASTLRGAPP